MSTLTTTRNYATGTILYKSDFDDFLNDIETFFNTTKITDGNIQGQGISGNLKLGDATITTAKIANSNITTIKIPDQEIKTVNIADSNITTAKIADANVTTAKINDLAVTTAKVIDANITTAKIADSNVTAAKLSAINDARSSSAIVGTQAATASYAALTNGSVTITASGSRPILIMVRNEDTSNPVNLFQVDHTNITPDFFAQCYVKTLHLYKGGSPYKTFGGFRLLMDEFASGSATLNLPSTCFTFLDTNISAGSITYQIGISDNSGTLAYGGFKLYAREL
jgi:hypothetical protein